MLLQPFRQAAVVWRGGGSAQVLTSVGVVEPRNVNAVYVLHDWRWIASGGTVCVTVVAIPWTCEAVAPCAKVRQTIDGRWGGMNVAVL
jgi:hypothetical protein